MSFGLFPSGHDTHHTFNPFYGIVSRIIIIIIITVFLVYLNLTLSWNMLTISESNICTLKFYVVCLLLLLHLPLSRCTKNTSDTNTYIHFYICMYIYIYIRFNSRSFLLYNTFTQCHTHRLYTTRREHNVKSKWEQCSRKSTIISQSTTILSASKYLYCDFLFIYIKVIFIWKTALQNEHTQSHNSTYKYKYTFLKVQNVIFLIC